MRGQKIDWSKQPLGEVSDGEISRRLAKRGIYVSRQSVAHARRSRGIKPSNKHRLTYEAVLAIAIRIVKGEVTAASEARRLGMKYDALSERLHAIKKSSGKTALDVARDIVNGKAQLDATKQRRCLKCGELFCSSWAGDRICVPCETRNRQLQIGEADVWDETFALYL